jgi:ubiquinone/menaquinone biosynthesis C-methylase UbiE
MTRAATQTLDESIKDDLKTRAIASIIRSSFNLPVRSRALVVGCGSGLEAVVLARELDVRVIGVDISGKFDSRAAQAVDLRQGDATHLEFDDGSFDLIYSFHALEHIPDYQKALSEFRRVLRSDGIYCIGTPNRHRLIGYLGGRGATLWNKLHWNLVDWKAMLLGRFRNEYGAHAGYSQRELHDILLQHFPTARDVSVEYYRLLYPKFTRVICGIVSTGLSGIVFPSIYFIGSR